MELKSIAPLAQAMKENIGQLLIGKDEQLELVLIGLFAGGMMLGSMLSHLFGGLGGGMMADILGLVMNILMVAAVFLILRWAWNKFRGRGKETNVYRASRMNSQPQEPLNVTPHSGSQQRMEIHDIKGPDDGYEAKSTADKYRSR